MQHALQSLSGSNYSAGVAEVASETQSTQWQALNPDAPNDPNREAINRLARKLDVPDAALRDGLRNLHGASQAAGGVNSSMTRIPRYRRTLVRRHFSTSTTR